MSLTVYQQLECNWDVIKFLMKTDQGTDFVNAKIKVVSNWTSKNHQTPIFKKIQACTEQQIWQLCYLDCLIYSGYIFISGNSNVKKPEDSSPQTL